MPRAAIGRKGAQAVVKGEGVGGSGVGGERGVLRMVAVSAVVSVLLLLHTRGASDRGAVVERTARLGPL